MTRFSDSIRFIEGTPPKSFHADYDSSLYNKLEYRLLQNETSWVEFHAVSKSDRKILASIYFYLNKKKSLSPWRAPYGSFELSKKISAKHLAGFVNFYEGRLRRKGINRITIKNYPALYQPKLHDIVSVALFNHGYKTSNAEIGACISIDDLHLLKKMDKWEVRRLKQGTRAGLHFMQLKIANLEEVYSFIEKCRVEKGYELSMSWEELEYTVMHLKSSFQLFGVYLNDRLVSASISIHVNKGILYNFYSAHDKRFDKLSPVVYLINSMYRWSFDRGIKLLDLGTSALDGKPNYSLLDFKLRLGGNPCMKLTFEKSLK